MLGEEHVEESCVADVSFKEERSRIEVGSIAGRQVVEDRYRVPSRAEHLCRHAPNESSTAGDEDVHLP